MSKQSFHSDRLPDLHSAHEYLSMHTLSLDILTIALVLSMFA